MARFTFAARSFQILALVYRSVFMGGGYRSLLQVCLQRQSLGDACQSRKMEILLNSLSFVFKILFLPKYRVKYYDYIVKWFSGI